MKKFLLFVLSISLFPSLVSAGTATLEWEQFVEYPTFKELRIYRGGPQNCPLIAPLPPLLNGLGGTVGTPVIIPKAIAPLITPRVYVDAQVPDVTQTVCYEMTSVNTLGQESERSKRKMLLYRNTIPIPVLDQVE